MPFRLLAGCVLLAAVHCPGAAAAEDATGFAIGAPSSRTLILDNGLQAVLISDPALTTAAFSIDLAVGNADNPPGWDGLAHWLEHVLVVGPGARGTDGVNGYTSFDHTNYQVVVRPGRLERALGRWGAMLERPKISAHIVESELSSVEGEFRLGLSHEGRRALEVLQSQMNPAHPYARFSQGNAASLGVQDTEAAVEAMEDFFERHYTANRMRLAVVGPQALDDLQQWASRAFSDVPPGTPPREIAAPIFTTGTLPRQLNLQPAGTLRQLQVLFPIPDPRPENTSKPDRVIAHRIGDEGPGSLLALLRDEGLAEGLSTGTTVSWRGGALFGVTIDLTPRGLDSVEAVLESLFGLLSDLRRAPPDQVQFDEMARMAELGHRHAETPEPRIRAATLAAQLQDHPPGAVFDGPWLMTGYDPDAIERFLAPLRPDNALVLLTAPGLATDLRTEHYDVPYAIEPVGAERLAAWHAAGPDSRLLAPPANPWIPGEPVLVAPTTGRPPAPERVIDRIDLSAWFAPDATQGQALGAIDLQLRGPAIESARQEAHLNLHAALLVNHLEPFSYPALSAGIQQGASVSGDGLSIRVRGFSEKLPAFTQQLWARAKAYRPDPSDFDTIRSALMAELTDRQVTAPPARRVLDQLDAALLPYRNGPGAVAAALADISPAEQVAWQTQFWERAAANLLVTGNFTRESFDLVAQACSTTFSSTAAPPQPPRIRTLAPGATERISESRPGDSAAAWYLQSANPGIEQRVFFALSAELLGPELRHQIRDRAQLGYYVESLALPLLDRPGLLTVMQSPSATPGEAARALEQVIFNLPARIGRAEFSHGQQKLVRRLAQPHRGLYGRADALWTDLLDGNERFDTRERLAEAVEALAFRDWEARYVAEVIDRQRALLIESGPPGDADVEQAPGPVGLAHD